MGFDTSGLLPLSDALQGMLAQLDGCCDSEQLPLPEALGRVLAMDIASPLSVPPFDNSAMDGFAIRAEDAAVGAEHARPDGRILLLRSTPLPHRGRLLLASDITDQRYIENQIRENFGLTGTPMRLLIREHGDGSAR